MLGISEFIHSEDFLALSRLEPTAFTRKRKLSFPVVITAFLSCFKASVQSELNTLFANLDNRADLLQIVTAQAFTAARKKLSHLAFVHLNKRLFELVAEQSETPLWNGHRVVAADASKVRLYLKGAVKRCMQDAIAFALYLPGLELTLSWELYSEHVAERQMLFEHLDHLDTNDLLVLDRGYPANWLYALLLQRQIDFCMRIDNTGIQQVKTFLRSNEMTRIIELSAPGREVCADYGIERQTMRLRLVRVRTPKGHDYALITSLLDTERYPSEAFSALYHSRWRIEEAFKRLKHRLALENTSGETWLAAQQDFGAKMVADNLHSLAVLDATQQVALEGPYKINRTYAFSVLKRCLPRWLLVAPPSLMQLVKTFEELAKSLIRFVPDASKPRPIHPKPHRKHAYKSTN